MATAMKKYSLPSPISLFLKIIIQTIRNCSIYNDDLKVRSEILTYIKDKKTFEPSESSNLIWKKLARVARHDAVDNIPKTLKNLLSLKNDLENEKDVSKIQVIKENFQLQFNDIVTYIYYFNLYYNFYDGNKTEILSQK